MRQIAKNIMVLFGNYPRLIEKFGTFLPSGHCITCIDLGDTEEFLCFKCTMLKARRERRAREEDARERRESKKRSKNLKKYRKNQKKELESKKIVSNRSFRSAPRLIIN